MTLIGNSPPELMRLASTSPSDDSTNELIVLLPALTANTLWPSAETPTSPWESTIGQTPRPGGELHAGDGAPTPPVGTVWRGVSSPFAARLKTAIWLIGASLVSV